MVVGFVLGVEIVGINAANAQPRLARDYKHVRRGGREAVDSTPTEDSAVISPVNKIVHFAG